VSSYQLTKVLVGQNENSCEYVFPSFGMYNFKDMREESSLVQTDIGQTFEMYGNQFTIRSANTALKLARAKGQPEEIAIAIIQLAHLHFRQGRYNQTRTLADEVLRDSPSDSPMHCDALRMLGNCAAEVGDPEEAENYYQQAIDLARQLDYRYALYKCLHSLATNIYWPRGQFGLCLAAGKEALAQAQALGLGEELWFPLSDIAWVYWSTGQRELANQVADQMATIVSPGSLGEGFCCCLRAGLVEPGEGSLNTALPLYERARSIAETSGDPGLNVEVRLGMCRAYRSARDLPAAMLWGDDAVAVSMRMNYRQFQGLALIERGRTMLEIDDSVRAETDLRAALDIATQLGSTFDQARTNLYLAALLTAQNRPEAAATWQLTTRLILENGYDFLIEQERALIVPWIADTLNAADPLIANTSTALFDRLMRLPAAPIQVKTFGKLSLQVGPNLISKESLRQRRAGELLAVLLSSPGYTRSAEQVTEILCPEKDPKAAMDFYHHAISALRSLLEPDLPDRRFPCRYLEVSEGRVTLIIPPGSTIDFLEFEQHLQNKAWEKAAAIYEGEFLPMYCYAEWTIALRQYFADQFEQVLLSLATDQLNLGEAARCLELARQALLLNAWQEQAVELGMRAALQLGDRVIAMKLYRRLEKKLDQELGIAPQAELQALFAEARKRPRII
jgi:DNA-binding SARP family transcriptional activator/Tfp pilus assembly protein PilF